jgi:hypothetical protein
MIADFANLGVGRDVISFHSLSAHLATSADARR